MTRIGKMAARGDYPCATKGRFLFGFQSRNRGCPSVTFVTFWDTPTLNLPLMIKRLTRANRNPLNPAFRLRR